MKAFLSYCSVVAFYKDSAVVHSKGEDGGDLFYIDMHWAGKVQCFFLGSDGWSRNLSEDPSEEMNAWLEFHELQKDSSKATSLDNPTHSI